MTRMEEGRVWVEFTREFNAAAAPENAAAAPENAGAAPESAGAAPESAGVAPESAGGTKNKTLRKGVGGVGRVGTFR
jgi:hypothetical protein